MGTQRTAPPKAAEATGDMLVTPYLPPGRADGGTPAPNPRDMRPRLVEAVSPQSASVVEKPTRFADCIQAAEEALKLYPLGVTSLEMSLGYTTRTTMARSPSRQPGTGVTSLNLALHRGIYPLGLGRRFLKGTPLTRPRDPVVPPLSHVGTRSGLTRTSSPSWDTL